MNLDPIVYKPINGHSGYFYLQNQTPSLGNILKSQLEKDPEVSYAAFRMQDDFDKTILLHVALKPIIKPVCNKTPMSSAQGPPPSLHNAAKTNTTLLSSERVIECLKRSIQKTAKELDELEKSLLSLDSQM